MRRFTVAVISLGLLAGSGCATPGSSRSPCEEPASASRAFPSSTLEDWVTYGDHAVVLRGVGELEQNGSEGVRLRRERTLWSREQAPAPPPAETFGGTHRRHDAAAAARDHQYLLIGTWWDDQQDGEPGWAHLELLAFDDGVVGRGSAGCRPRLSDPASGRTAVWGRTEAEVAGLLDRTPPDPDAVPFLALGPDERWQQLASTR
ncbi:hypothetical protein GCM10009616_14760 [Microlunatus lacustris]